LDQTPYVETKSPEGFARNARIEDDVPHGDTMFGGSVVAEYDPDTDKSCGKVVRNDGTQYLFRDIGCPAFPSDTNESRMNNLLQVADIGIKYAENRCRT
jgi:hypothetical protein